MPASLSKTIQLCCCKPWVKRGILSNFFMREKRDGKRKEQVGSLRRQQGQVGDQSAETMG